MARTHSIKPNAGDRHPVAGARLPLMHPRSLRVSLRACVSLLGLAIGSSVLASNARAESPLPPALPQAGRVLSGSADIATGSQAMTIAQSGQAAVIDWRSFDIGAGNQVNFVQPDAQAVTLNLVTGETASVLSGSLTATGSVVLLNPNGIAITPTGTVDVGSGFAASSLALTGIDEQGRLRFRGNGQSAPVSNAGRITVGAQGFAALVGGSVANSGLVTVPMGRITLAAGETATIDTFGDGFLQIALGNGGVPLAGQSATLLQMSGSTAHAAWREVVTLSSDVAATSVRQEGNAVVFGDVPAAGGVALSGRLDASSLNTSGGTITVAGQSVALAGARLDVSGTTGGTIAVGGGALGLAVAGMAAAREARLDEGTLLNASGSAGNGGTVTVWGGDLLDYRGQIVATGAGGDGGSAEVSGMGAYVYGGTTNLLSQGGRTGTLLLDPGTIIICRSGDAGCAGATSLAAIQGDASTTSTAYLQDTTLASALTSASVALAASVQITDSSSAVAVTTGSGGGLTLTAPNITLAGSYGVAGGLTLNNTDATSSISGVISGAGGLTYNGPTAAYVSGIATPGLSLSAANTYSGATTVNSGVLALTGTTSSSGFAVASGAVLQVGNSTADYNFNTLNSTITGAGTLQKVGSRTLIFAGPSSQFTFAMSAGGLIDVQQGTVVGGTYMNDVWTGNLSSLNIAAGANFRTVEANVEIDKLTGSGTLTTGFVGAGYSRLTIGVGNGSSTFNGSIVDTDLPNGAIGNLRKVGTGTITLAGNNTFTGTTTISGGTLQIGGAGTLGGGSYAGAIAISTGATLQYSSSAAQTLSGIISLGGALTKDTSAASTLTLTGANTFTGTTTVGAGTLAIGDVDSLGSAGSNVVVASGATLNISASTAGTATYSHTWSGGGAINFSKEGGGSSPFLGGNGTAFTGTLTTSGTGKTALGSFSSSLDLSNANLVANASATVIWGGQNLTVGSLSGTGTVRSSIGNTGNSTLTVGNLNSNTTFSGIISDGTSPLNLQKVGSGTLTLTGANTYTGATTISAGTLALTSAGALNLTSPISGSSGTLTISAGSGSAITANNSVAVGTFNLNQGAWSQLSGALPAFSATSFTVGSGASFLRATGGTGAVATPYTITDVYGLQGIGTSATYRGNAWQLAGTIDASGTSGWNAGAGFAPIGTSSAIFTGTLDGNGNSITGLTINRAGTSNVGLIGFSTNATIKNLTLSGFTVTGTGNVGGVGGKANTVTASNLFVQGTVNGSTTAVGGIFGGMSGSLTSAFANVAVSNSSTNSGQNGGAVGYANSATLSQVATAGSVDSLFNWSGGLVGWAEGVTIANSYSTAKLTSGSSIGGLIGPVVNGTTLVTNSYFAGTVKSGSGAVISGVGSGGTWSASSAGIYVDSSVAGTTNIGSYAGVSGLATTAMQTQGTFTGWDFSTIWLAPAPGQYPLLRSLTNVVSGAGNLTISDAAASATNVNIAALLANLAIKPTVVESTGGTVTVVDPVSSATASGLFITGASGVAVNNGLTLSNSRAVLTLRSGNAAVSGSGAIATGGQLNLYAGAGSGTLSGTISGAASLQAIGPGTVVLGGTNTYTGITALRAGTLQISADANLGAAPASFQANSLAFSGGGLTIVGGTTLNANRGITLTGTGSITTTTTVNYAGRITGAGQTLSVGGSDLVLLNTTGTASNANFDVTGGRLFFDSTNALGSGTTQVRSGATLVFNGAASTTISNTITLLSGAGLGSRATGAVFTGVTLPTSGTVVFNSDDQPSSTMSVAANIALSGNLAVQVGGQNATVGTTTLSGVLSGSGSLTKTGTGTLLLSGANTYTGATTVSLGTLMAGSTTGFGSNSATTVASGAQLDLAGRSLAIGSLAGAGTVTNSSATAATLTSGGLNASTIFSGVLQNGAGTLGVTKSGTGSLTLSGANAYTGATNIVGGVLKAGSTSALGNNSATIVNSGTQLDLAGNSLAVGSFGGAGTITNSSTTQAILTSGSLNTASTFGGVMQDGAGKVGLTQTGTAMLTLVNSGITYSGPTTVSSGTIRLQDTTNFASAATVNTGARLSLMRSVTGFANRSRLSTTISGAGSLTIDSPVDGIAGGWVLFTNGAGLASDFTGTVAVNQGVLSLQGGTALWAATPAVAVASKGLLALRDQSLILSSLTGAGTVINSSASGATQTLTVSTAGDMTFAGSIRGSIATVGTDGAADQGVLNLVKTGSGTLTLSGANTFAGSTTVTGGTVSLSGSWNLGSGTATTSVASGATLSGTGAITAATLAHSGGGTLNLTGNNLVSRLTTSGTVGPLTFTSSSALTVDSIITANARVALSSRFAGSANSALVLGPGTIIATNGGALSLSGSAGPVEFNGASLLTGGGALTVTGAMGSYALPVSLDGQSTASSPLGILLRNTTVDLGGGVGSIAATGGALVLQGTNLLSSTSASGITVNGSRAYGVLLEAQTGLTTSGKVVVSSTSRTGSITPGMQIGAGAMITASSGSLTLGGGNTLANGVSGLVFSPGAGSSLVASPGASLTVIGEASVAGSGSGIFVNTPLTTSGAVTMTGTSVSGTGILLGDTLASAGGTLTLAGTGGAIGLSSDQAIAITSGTLDITSAGNDWLTGPLSGGGSLNKSGLGTLTLTGTNTYSGATTITAGTLAVQGAGMLGGGDYAGAITLGGTIAFNTVADQRLSGPISLTANSVLTNSSANMLTLGGELALGGKQLTLLGNGTGADDGTPYGGGTRNMILSGLISGTGSLQIGNTIGANLLISGANTFTGTVTLGCAACLYTPASVLTLTNSAALGTGNTALTSLGGGEIHLQNSITLPSSISLLLSGSLSQNDIATTGAVLSSDSGNNVVEGPVQFWSGAGNPAMHAAAGTSLTLNGAISAGSLPRTLLLDGAGNITLNGSLSDGTTQLGVLVGSLSGATTGTMSLNGASTYTGTTTVAGGTLNLGGSWTPASGLATVAVSSGAMLTGSGAINAATLAASGSGVLDLAGANSIGRLQTAGPIGSLRLNTGQSLTAGSIDASGPIALTTTRGSGASLTLDPGAVLSSTASGTAITLAADRAFINNAGAGALTAPNGRWLVYAAAPTGNTFGGLDSGNQAVWTTASGAEVGATGNRYAFAYQPTVTITVPDQSKTYGKDGAAILAASYTLTGLEPGIAGAYLGDTAAVAFAGNPDVTSAGAAARAVVSSVPYSITLAPGSVAPRNGYAVAYGSAGSLTIDRAFLTLVYTADPATSVYGSAMAPLSGVVAGRGFVGADGVSSLLGQAVWASDARQAAGTYAISGSGLFSPNYEITAVQAPGNASAYRVEQAPLQIAVNDATMTYSGAAWSGGNGIRFGGLVNGDAAGDLQGALEWTGSAQGATQVGQYGLSATGLTSPNYAITWVPGTLSILSPVVDDVAPTSVAQRETLQRSSSVTGLCRLTTSHKLQPAEATCTLEYGAGR